MNVILRRPPKDLHVAHDYAQDNERGFRVEQLQLDQREQTPC